MLLILIVITAHSQTLKGSDACSYNQRMETLDNDNYQETLI